MDDFGWKIDPCCEVIVKVFKTWFGIVYYLLAAFLPLIAMGLLIAAYVQFGAGDPSLTYDEYKCDTGPTFQVQEWCGKGGCVYRPVVSTNVFNRVTGSLVAQAAAGVGSDLLSGSFVESPEAASSQGPSLVNLTSVNCLHSSDKQYLAVPLPDSSCVRTCPELIFLKATSSNIQPIRDVFNGCFLSGVIMMGIGGALIVFLLILVACKYAFKPLSMYGFC
eukprot:TRINITY_DN7120_c0_g1_i1.p1 TRINITY_DN7120_c0_g1~~TRINITY_DN7120_c0_g1_i1.p1  ORF type:complete len:220 (-),score=1.31 TRINITY_DN7120_c0_g1_i1:198-857(-)